MGQKTNPNGLRLGINKDWVSRYYPYSNKDWAIWTVQDRKVRNYLFKYYKIWAISRVEVERTSTEYKLIIKTARPGTIIGEEGKTIKKIELNVSKILKNKKLKISIDVLEVEYPDLDATILANEIAVSLENRVPFRIAQKKIIQRAMRSGAKGIKTQVSGRLNGVDMARTEGYSKGEVPLQTIRNDIDYAIAEAKTTYGILGVKVWVSKGEIIDGKHVDLKLQKPLRRPRQDRRNRRDFNFQQQPKPETKREDK